MDWNVSKYEKRIHHYFSYTFTNKKEVEEEEMRISILLLHIKKRKFQQQ